MDQAFEFDHRYHDEWQFDQNDEPTSPGCRSLAEHIASALVALGARASEPKLHSFYGWGIHVSFEDQRYYAVLNPGGSQAVLTVGTAGGWVKRLLSRRARTDAREFLHLVCTALSSLDGVTNINQSS